MPDAAAQIRVTVDKDHLTKQVVSSLKTAEATPLRLKIDDRSFTQKLGRITGAADEFDKSLAASNARVIAFGASAGIIFGVERAFSELVKTTIQVEKSLAEMNVIFNASESGLKKFSDQLFNIAKYTGQSFKSVTSAATEFARQGLGVEETLKRTRDALILSRQANMDVSASVSTVTAGLNSFNKAVLTSTDLVNKLANVDAKFAVSSSDLAEAIKRVGSSAQDVGVDLDELIGLITSAQQTTSRGGPVIGNALKTIFQKIQRPEVIDQLEVFGIEVKNLSREVLPASTILVNLASAYDKLGQSQKSQVAEMAGGIYQINQLKALLGDLSKQYSIFNDAQETSRKSTDEAIVRNERLNKTLSTLVNETLVNMTKAGSAIGQTSVSPAIRLVLESINSAIEGIGSGNEGIGAKLGKGVLEGLGNFLSGPGLAVAFYGLFKLVGNFAKFTLDAFKSVLEVNKGFQQQQQIAERINSLLAENPTYIDSMLNKSRTLLQVENEILTNLTNQLAKKEAIATFSGAIASNLMTKGVSVKNNEIVIKGKGKAGGHIPNFRRAGEASEIIEAIKGGYMPGQVKTMTIPGIGKVTYNSREKIKNFPGMDSPAIMPPSNSKAGKTYKDEFEKKHGFNPYMAEGFIPESGTSRIQRKRGFQPEVQRRLDTAVEKLSVGIEKGVIKGDGISRAVENLVSKFGVATKGVEQINKEIVRSKKVYEMNNRGKIGEILNPQGGYYPPFLPSKYQPSAGPTFNPMSLAVPQQAERLAGRRSAEAALGNLATIAALPSINKIAPPSFTASDAYLSSIKSANSRANDRDSYYNKLEEMAGGKDPRSLKELSSEERRLLMDKKINEQRAKRGVQVYSSEALSSIREQRYSDYRSGFQVSPVSIHEAKRTLTPEELQAKQTRIRRIQNIGMGASLIAPMMAGAAGEALFHGEGRNDRVGRAAAFGVGDVASYAGLGALVGGGAPGAIAGGAIGSLMAVSRVFKEWDNYLPELQKNLEQTTESIQRTSETLGSFAQVSEKLEEFNRGRVDLRRFEKEQLDKSQTDLLMRLSPDQKNRMAAAVNLGGLDKIQEVISEIGREAQGVKVRDSLAVDIEGFRKSKEATRKKILGYKTVPGVAYGASPARPMPYEQPIYGEDEFTDQGKLAINKITSEFLGLNAGIGNLLESAINEFKNKNSPRGVLKDSGFTGLLQLSADNKDPQGFLSALKAGGVSQEDVSRFSEPFTRLDKPRQEALMSELASKFSDKEIETALKTQNKLEILSNKVLKERQRFTDSSFATNQKLQSLSISNTFSGRRHLSSLTSQADLEDVRGRANIDLAGIYARPEQLEVLNTKRAIGGIRNQKRAALGAANNSFQGGVLDTLSSTTSSVLNSLTGSGKNESEIEKAHKSAETFSETLRDFQSQFEEAAGQGRGVEAVENFVSSLEKQRIELGNALSGNDSLAKLGETKDVLEVKFKSLGDLISKLNASSQTYVETIREANLTEEQAIRLEKAKEKATIDLIIAQRKAARMPIGYDTMDSYRELFQNMEGSGGLLQAGRKLEGYRQELLGSGKDAITQERLLAVRGAEMGYAAGSTGYRGGSASGRQLIALREAQNEAKLANNTFGAADIGGTFMDSWAYNTKDLLIDLKDTAGSVAGDIKGSFSEAFREIRTGAKSAKDAFRDMGMNILGRIADRTFEMGLNALVGGTISAGKAYFGKGYSSGGLVTGGSGTKDDVPAQLTSGEYVIKKSAVNSIGKDILEHINNGGEIAVTNSGEVKAARLSLANEFVYDDPLKPKGGALNVDKNLSNFALSNEDELQNARRMNKEDALYSYLAEKSQYEKAKKQALSDWKKQQKQAITSAYIQTGISLVGAAVSAGVSHAGAGGKRGRWRGKYGGRFGNVCRWRSRNVL
jgi:TP901 family phage tail tape measure protein